MESREKKYVRGIDNSGNIEERISGILRRHLQHAAAVRWRGPQQGVARCSATLASAGQASQKGEESAAGGHWGVDLGKDSLKSWGNVLPLWQGKHSCDDYLSAESAGARSTWGIFHEDFRPVALHGAAAQARPAPSRGAPPPS